MGIDKRRCGECGKGNVERPNNTDWDDAIQNRPGHEKQESMRHDSLNIEVPNNHLNFLLRTPVRLANGSILPVGQSAD
jgi:hypothetical protein